ncbi:MAG: Plug domain-containing protein [Opitutales bacterium]|nr:Plug domain-containing protein [Opitutales bacterium]
MIQTSGFEKRVFLFGCGLLGGAGLVAEEVVELDEFRVTASLMLRTAEDFAQPAEVLSGSGLGQRLTASIGETLAGLPGVASTQYFPGASRPVIRGYSNDRIRVLSNGLDVIDASVGSHDHAVAIEPYRVERIEIIRGPATLAFGGNTVGGMVNVVDNRIPGRSDVEGERGILTAGLGHPGDRS